MRYLGVKILKFGDGMGEIDKKFAVFIIPLTFFF